MGPPLNGGEMAANRGGAGGGGVEPSGGGQRGEDGQLVLQCDMIG